MSNMKQSHLGFSRSLSQNVQSETPYTFRNVKGEFSDNFPKSEGQERLSSPGSRRDTPLDVLLHCKETSTGANDRKQAIKFLLDANDAISAKAYWLQQTSSLVQKIRKDSDATGE